MRNDPHTLVEGALVASFAMGAHAAYIYVRGEFIKERYNLEAAVAEAYDGRLIGKDNLTGWPIRSLRPSRRRRLHLRRRDGDAQVARRQEGDAPHETSLPAGMGLYGSPTTVNNVSQSPPRQRSCGAAPRGSPVLAPQQFRHQTLQRFRSRQQAVQRGRGDVDPVPRVDREALRRDSRRLGQSARRHSWRSVGAARSCRSDYDCPMDFNSLAKLKSGLGTAATIVMDKSTDIIRAIARLSYFYKHESCGQCTPCREGAGWMWRVMERMVQGRARRREIDMLLDVTEQVEGHTICALGDAAAWPIQGLIAHFRPEIERRAWRRPICSESAQRASARGGEVQGMSSHIAQLNMAGCPYPTDAADGGVHDKSRSH